MQINMTIFTPNREANTYVATYLHQQLRGNSNYVDNAIILNMDKDDRTYLLIETDMLKDLIPNIAIDWDCIDRIVIETPNGEIKNLIIADIKDAWSDYPSDVSGFDLLVNDLHPGKIIITGSRPHIVFSIGKWFNRKEN